MLSPLLANLYLDPLDKELERRGYCFVRYADDCNVYVGGATAADRVVRNLPQWIAKHLRLKVNARKTGVGRPWERKFLGFRITRKGQIEVAPESLKRLKLRVRCWRPWEIAQMWPSKIAHFWFLKRLFGGSHKEYLERFAERAGFCYVASLPGGGDAMFGSDKRVLLRHYLEQGMSKAAIARQLGVSRRTVYYWIQKGQLHRGGQEEPVQYGPRGPGRSKLDPYKAIIDARLAEYPKLTATRLYREVRKAGYGGGYGQVKRYVRQARPRAPEEPVQRFETAPGYQGQVDFADFRLPWGKRYALIVVLGYSRLMWFRYYERQTMPVVMRGLEASFDYFGGVPGELLFDQMKSVIVRDRREEGGRLIENREFVRFSRHWGFRVRACRPYRAQTKGKVERPIRYIRESFFYGRDFVSDADLNARARKWREEEANVRNHGTLRERPVDRFEREREYLIPLAPWPYHSNVVPVPEPPAPSLPAANWPRMVDVERRPLTEYARLTGGVA